MEGRREIQQNWRFPGINLSITRRGINNLTEDWKDIKSLKPIVNGKINMDGINKKSYLNGKES